MSDLCYIIKRASSQLQQHRTDCYDICLTLKQILPIFARLAIRTHKQMTNGSSTLAKSKTTKGYLSEPVSLCFPFPSPATPLQKHEIIHVHRQNFNKETPHRGDLISISTTIFGYSQGMLYFQ